MEKEKDFLKPEYYENRELSWLKFNHRVLNEARDKSIPLPFSSTTLSSVSMVITSSLPFNTALIFLNFCLWLRSIALAVLKIHGMGKRERLLLQAAAILHDCGRYVSLVNQSECSYQIIMASEIAESEDLFHWKGSVL